MTGTSGPWQLPDLVPGSDLASLLLLATLAIAIAVRLATRDEPSGRAGRAGRRERRRVAALLTTWLGPILVLALLLRGAWRFALVFVLALSVHVAVLRWRAARAATRSPRQGRGTRRESGSG